MQESITGNPTVTAIAWRMIAPSKSGGKVYSIAVVGEHLVTGWGRRDQAGPYGFGVQTQVQRFSTHQAALLAAQERTDEKSFRGYSIDIPPKQQEIVANVAPGGWAVNNVLAHGTEV